MELVKYDCGCIGFKPDSKGNATIIKVCDNNNGDSYGVLMRPMTSTKRGVEIIKKYTALSEEEHIHISTNIHSLISDGYRFREIKRLLT